MREARVRSLYSGQMVSRYTRLKQLVQGVSLGFSAAAVITVILEPWPEVTAALAGAVAIANAWAISTNLDQKLLTLAILRTSWEALRIEYSDLWSTWYEDGSVGRFGALQRRGNDLGMLASQGAPWDQRAVARWERFVDAELGGEGPPRPAPTV